MSHEKSTVVKVEERTLKMVSVLIADYPELGYKTIEQFVNDAIFDLLKRKALEIGGLQKWMKASSSKK